MKFIVLFEDNDEFAHKRSEHMSDHLEFLERNSAAIEAAGPLSDAESGNGAGGIWLVDAADRDRVQALVEEDPFWPTGLRKSIRILSWKQVYAHGQKLI